MYRRNFNLDTFFLFDRDILVYNIQHTSIKVLLLSDKNRIIPKSAIDEANIAPFTSKIPINEREI